MNKDAFQKFNATMVTCSRCGRTLPVKMFSYSSIRRDGTALECKVCGWKRRNSFDEEQNNSAVMNLILYYVFDDRNETLNPLFDKIDLPEDLVVQIIRDLKIGNRHVNVECLCKVCGTKRTVPLSVYIKDKNVYCSRECYWLDKHNYAGEKNPQYNRIQAKCTNCGKPIKIIPYDYNKRNRFGDSHNFCSQGCYWSFRGSYYRGAAGPMYQHEYTDGQIDTLRRALTVSNTKQQNRNTSIQLLVNEMLEELKIAFIREKVIDYYSIDNYLSDYDLAIEVMGDYWHASPIRYGLGLQQINKKQLDGIHRDKLKKSYLKNHYGLNILYLWEKDIKKRPLLCKKLIAQYVVMGGQLKDYNSFNYDIIDDGVSMKPNPIVPYMDIPIEFVKQFLKAS